MDAPLFFSLSDSGRLRRPVYLHLLWSTERKGDLRAHEAEREGNKNEAEHARAKARNSILSRIYGKQKQQIQISK